MKLLLFLIIFSGVITAAWIYFLPVILTSTLQKQTGFGVKVAELRINPFNAKVDLADLVITNSEGFPRSDFIEVRSFNANAKIKTLFSSCPVFDYAMVEVACVTFVRNADGVLNVQLFNDRLNPLTPEQLAAKEEARKAAAKSKKRVPDAVATTGGPVEIPKPEKKPAANPAKAKPGEPLAKDKPANPLDLVEKSMPFLIHHLQLRLDKVIIADFSGAVPVVREYPCKLFYTFKEFNDPKQLLAPFALKSLEAVGNAIRGLIPGDIGKTMGAVTKPAEPMLKKDADENAEDPLKTVVEKLEESQKP